MEIGKKVFLWVFHIGIYGVKSAAIDQDEASFEDVHPVILHPGFLHQHHHEVSRPGQSAAGGDGCIDEVHIDRFVAVKLPYLLILVRYITVFGPYILPER